MRPVRYKRMYPAGFFVIQIFVRSDFADILWFRIILYMF